VDLTEEQEIFPVPEVRLKRLMGSKKLRPFLGHSKLQGLIRKVNSSRQRKKALEKLCENDEDFQNFVDLLLEEMGYFKDGVFTTEN
jgi:hypothetical protein